MKGLLNFVYLIGADSAPKVIKDEVVLGVLGSALLLIFLVILLSRLNSNEKEKKVASVKKEVVKKEVKVEVEEKPKKATTTKKAATTKKTATKKKVNKK